MHPVEYYRPVLLSETFSSKGLNKVECAPLESEPLHKEPAVVYEYLQVVHPMHLLIADCYNSDAWGTFDRRLTIDRNDDFECSVQYSFEYSIEKPVNYLGATFWSKLSKKKFSRQNVFP